jgi:alpha-D-xyloside xylohydrolase
MSGVNFWPPNLKYRSGVKLYDCYNPKARDIYWEHLNEGLFKLGINAWWMDSTDPDHFYPKEEDYDHQTYLCSFRCVRNAYPLMTVGGVSDHQRAETNKKRICILTRSGFLGQQRYGANVWTGDVQSTWDVLRRQIPSRIRNIVSKQKSI